MLRFHKKMLVKKCAEFCQSNPGEVSKFLKFDHTKIRKILKNRTVLANAQTFHFNLGS